MISEVDAHKVADKKDANNPISSFSLIQLLITAGMCPERRNIMIAQSYSYITKRQQQKKCIKKKD